MTCELTVYKTQPGKLDSEVSCEQSSVGIALQEEN